MIKNNKIIISLIVIALFGGVLGYNMINSKDLKDGIYKAYGESYTESGYKPFVVLQVENGRMVDALLDYVNVDGELLTKNKEMKHIYKETTGTFPSGFTKELRADVLIRQGTSTIENASANKNAIKTFKTLIDELIDKRIKQGKEEILTIKL